MTRTAPTTSRKGSDAVRDAVDSTTSKAPAGNVVKDTAPLAGLFDKDGRQTVLSRIVSAAATDAVGAAGITWDVVKRQLTDALAFLPQAQRAMTHVKDGAPQGLFADGANPDHVTVGEIVAAGITPYAKSVRANRRDVVKSACGRIKR